MAKKKTETAPDESVASIVRDLESSYKVGQTTISEYVTFSLKENVEKIDAYLNSKFTGSQTDSKERDKPFYNIVTAAANIWYRATDIDRKDIHISAVKASNVIPALCASIKVQDWMRRENFGVFLNEWGRVLARYGSAIVKFVKKDKRLVPSVVKWNTVIVDSVRFDNAPVIEVLDLTEDQLRSNKSYDQNAVEELCNAKTTRKTLDGQNKDTKSDFIRVYEVHGKFPLSTLKLARGEKATEADEKELVEQIHVISYAKKDGKSDEYNDYTLYAGKEDNPYMITHLIEEDGRTMAIGAVEHLFDAQWMLNHTMLNIKNQLDVSSKLLFQSPDDGYIGRNVLTSVDTGDILTYKTQPLAPLANNAHDVGALQNYAMLWKNLGQEVTNTPDAMMGATSTNLTTWRQTEALLNESHSLFELMIENKALALENMLREFVIPFIKTQELNNKDEIVATLKDNGVKMIEEAYISAESAKRYNKKLIDSIINRTERPTLEGEQTGVMKELQTMGENRFFKPTELDTKTWKELFDDLEWKVEVDISGENRDIQSTLTTLTTALKTVASNPGILQDSNTRMIFNKILEATGALSPLEISSIQTLQAPQTPSTTTTPTAAAQISTPAAPSGARSR